MAIKVQGDTVIFDDKVFRPARMTTAERNAISSPTEGMIVYDTDFNKAFLYNGTNWEAVVAFDAVIIATPTITVEGAPNEVPEDPTITTSAFNVTQGSDSHLSTDWEIRKTSNNEVVFESLNDTSNLTSITVPEGILEESSTEYEFRARHRSATFFVSDFESEIATTLEVFDELDGVSLGDSACGGIYMGAITAAGQCYALIVAPNATGCACCQWKTTRTASGGALSFVNGFGNTYLLLNNLDHPAGNWTATRSINGFSDWYLPAVDELKEIYNNGATGNNESVIGVGEAFFSQRYWSSTENYPVSAFDVDFRDGTKTNILKNYPLRVRAVRREPI